MAHKDRARSKLSCVHATKSIYKYVLFDPLKISIYKYAHATTSIYKYVLFDPLKISIYKYAHATTSIYKYVLFDPLKIMSLPVRADGGEG